MIIYNRTEYSELTPKTYQKEKKRLQVELLKLQESTIDDKKRLAIVFEGRDAAGKGSTIKRFIEHLMPKAVNVIELGIPTKKENKGWFKTWERLMPESGQINFYDRSWYSRALIQPAMGYCTQAQYKYFIKKVNDWEYEQIKNGLILIKFYLSISKDSQNFRFQIRENHQLKYWKLSSNDWKAHQRWKILTNYKEQMFNRTSTYLSPWVVINSDNKMIARLNAMRYVLKHLDYNNKKDLKQKKWSKEPKEYEIVLDDIKFSNLTQDQFNILYKLKVHES